MEKPIDMEPLDPLEAAKLLRQMSEDGNIAWQHEEADRILLQVIFFYGRYDTAVHELIDSFQKLEKWYS